MSKLYNNQLYESQGKPWTHCSAASNGEFNQLFSSAVVVCEGGLKVYFPELILLPVCYLLKQRFSRNPVLYPKAGSGPFFRGNPRWSAEAD